MIRALMDYGALSAKAKSMYGRRLRLSDFRRMAALHSEAELLDYLKSHPAWQASTAQLSGGIYIGRVELEQALWSQLRTDYQKLLHFVPRADEPLLSFPILLREQRAILSALRRLKSGRSAPASLPPSITGSRLDLEALARCDRFEDLAAAAADTIYADALRQIQPREAGALPSYTAAEHLLRTVCFSHIYRTIDKLSRGQVRSSLLRTYGEQIDWIDLTALLRLKAYFPGEIDPVSVLFPLRYKLRPEWMRALWAAPDLSAALALLRDGPYPAAAGVSDVEALEDAGRRSFCQLERRILMSGPPSVCSAVAYLCLKELELHALVSLIESVKYGVPYDISLAECFGE